MLSTVRWWLPRVLQSCRDFLASAVLHLFKETGFPQWLSSKESAWDAGDVGDAGLIPGSGRSPGEGNGNLLQYSCLENSTEKGAWRASVHGVAECRKQLSNWTHTVQFSSVAQSCPTLCDPGVHPNPRPLTRWCHPTISSSVVPFSSCPQSFPASGSFPVSQLFASGGQSIGVSASTSVLPMNSQDWPPLGWTVWTSLQCTGL